MDEILGKEDYEKILKNAESAVNESNVNGVVYGAIVSMAQNKLKFFAERKEKMKDLAIENKK